MTSLRARLNFCKPGAYASEFATTLCASFACAVATNDPGVHILLHPSAIRTIPHLDKQAGLEAQTQDVLTVPASLVGLPALRAPMTIDEEGWVADSCEHRRAVGGVRR
jgi:Asp-tRNA(Asn)/Glu-tRNA(Gln) amidotransferase A subunit family amidase